ncbi:hypothetical protein [Acidipila sp. EB88]|uniref:hypothetical protein n=1 Tax=Acidipila sp. EB88 TaxID=2305226 RepID=UPI000F5FEEFF|nr:hypothetical protein [Acidipila sp. EB88]
MDTAAEAEDLLWVHSASSKSRKRFAQPGVANSTFGSLARDAYRIAASYNTVDPLENVKMTFPFTTSASTILSPFLRINMTALQCSRCKQFGSIAYSVPAAGITDLTRAYLPARSGKRRRRNDKGARLQCNALSFTGFVLPLLKPR